MVNVVIECPFREVLQKLSRRQRLSGSVKINPPPEQKSTVAVSGINHRLNRAPQVGEGSLKHCFKTSLGTKQLTSPKRSYITLNCKLAAPPLSRIMGSRRWQSRWWHSFAKRVFDESAEGQSLINYRTFGTVQVTCISNLF